MVEQSVLVAHAAVGADVDLQTRAPEAVHVRAGKPFRVRFSYHVRENARVEERWRFRLGVRVNDAAEEHTEVTLEDRRSRLDDVVSNLHQDLTLPRGEHVVHFLAEADMSTRSWNGDSSASRSIERQAGGTIRVRSD